MKGNVFFNVQELPENESDRMIATDDDMADAYVEPCEYTCATVNDFLRLTDEMVNTINDLEEELVRWRQALIKYLPPRWAEGLRQDIFCNLSRDFEGDPAYDLYVKLYSGKDPQHDKKRTKRLYRLAEGTDKTSITYL